MKKHLVLLYKNLLWGESLASLLNNNPEFHVIKMLEFNELPDLDYSNTYIFLIEASCPNVELIEHVEFLKKKKQRVIVVGFILDNQFVDIIIQLGVDGFVLKSDSKDNLFLSINQAHRSEKFFSASVTEILSNHLMHTNDSSSLTRRELDVLIGIVNMHSTHQIAQELNLSEATVRTHRKNIMHKFGAKNYIGLIRYACRNGMLESPGEQFCAGCSKEHCYSKQFG